MGKVETLRTIIAAKDGEIAALTAEVTHLAEKLAERDAKAGISTDWRVYHSALSECAEQLPNMKDGDPLTDAPKFLRMHLSHILLPTARLAAGVPASTGPDQQTYCTMNCSHKEACADCAPPAKDQK